MEADRQIFLAISNGGDQREAPRVFSMCEKINWRFEGLMNDVG